MTEASLVLGKVSLPSLTSFTIFASVARFSRRLPKTYFAPNNGMLVHIKECSESAIAFWNTGMTYNSRFKFGRFLPANGMASDDFEADQEIACLCGIYSERIQRMTSTTQGRARAKGQT